MSTIEVTNINDISGNASLVTDNGGLKTDKLTGKTTAGSISVVGEGNSTTTNLQQGLAKAWFNGSATPAVVNSFNISSVTDNSTGQFFFNYTNVMSAASTGAAAQPTSVDHITITCAGLTAMMRCYCFDGSAYVDTPLTGNVCGDLA